MNVVDSKGNEEIYDNEFDSEFINFVEILKHNAEDYDMLVDILNTIMWLNFAKLTLALMNRIRNGIQKPVYKSFRVTGARIK